MDALSARSLAGPRMVESVSHWTFGNFLHAVCCALSVVVFRGSGGVEREAVPSGWGRFLVVLRNDYDHSGFGCWNVVAV